VRDVVDHDQRRDAIVLDLSRVTQVGEPAARILLDLQKNLAERGKHLVLTGAAHSRLLPLVVADPVATSGARGVLGFADLDTALEWCENHLLALGGMGVGAPASVELAEHEICRSLDPAGLAHLERLLDRKRFASGDFIVRKGDPAEEIYLLMSGEVSVTVTLPDGRRKRLSTLSAGMTFGELAIVDRSDRSADVRADTAAECYVLSAAEFERLGDTAPKIQIALLKSMQRSAHQMVSRLNQEVAALAG